MKHMIKYGNLPPQYNWNIVESGVKHHKPGNPFKHNSIMHSYLPLVWKVYSLGDVFLFIMLKNIIETTIKDKLVYDDAKCFMGCHIVSCDYQV